MPVRTVSQKFIRPPMREDLQRIMGQTNNDCRFRILILTNSLTQQHLLCVQDWGMYWIKEVEMVESVCHLKSSCSIRGVRTPDCEVLDAKIASALNRIIHNTRFKKKVSLEEQISQKEDRFLRGRQIAYLIYQYFWVTNDSVENYADLFTVVLRNDDIQEFDSKWNEILMTSWKDCTI